MKSTTYGNLWMLVAGVFFACMGVLVKIGAQKFSSNELVFYRSLFGLLALFVVARGGGSTLVTRHWKMHLSRSLLGFSSLALYFYAITTLPLATAVTLNYTSPLFLAALTLTYFRQAARPVLLLSIAIGFVGVALLLQPSFSSGTWLPALLGLISGLLAGIVYLQIRQLGQVGEPELRTVFYFTLTCTIGSGLWMLIHQFHALTLPDLVLLCAMGACATLAQLAMTRAYCKGDLLVAGSLAYSTVILSSLFGILLWGEVLSPAGWIGVVLIVASGIISLRGRADFDKSAQAPTL
ncbi:riboflavin transporter [mine drainage metagenome]|uniref:Riboflavin transporter n=1 Tax=mine drainage metagenome TaxID=410659 RepID=A0A1J5QHQ0_9ZZZZ